MQLWKVAKERTPALGKMDIISQSCPDILHIADKPRNCFRDLEAREQCGVTTMDGIPIMCINCWEREL